MNLIGYENFKNTSAAVDFIKNNPDIGYLKILAFTAYQLHIVPLVLATLY